MSKSELDFLRQKLNPLQSMADILYDEPLRDHCTFKIGGRAAAFVIPNSTAAFAQAVGICRESGTGFFVLGRGSNVLFGDGFIEKVIISTMRLNGIKSSDDANKIAADAGALLKNIADYAQKHALSGFEFACGIPGTLGGAVYMNAGAHNGEIADVIESALVLDNSGNLRRIRKDEMRFSYRHSGIMTEGLTVLEATIALKNGDAEEISEKMRGHVESRNSRQPVDKPSAGSAFKRPADGVYAAALIEECGLKGHFIGGAQVSALHSGFIVNTGGAAASDVLALIEHIRGVVHKEKGYLLEPEIIYCT